MNSNQKFFTGLLAVLALMSITGSAHAEAWDDAAQGIQDAMYGSIGTTLAIIGVAGCGLAAFFGKMSFEKAGMVIAGIVVFFAAPSIVGYVKGKLGTTAFDTSVPAIYAVVETPKAKLPQGIA